MDPNGNHVYMSKMTIDTYSNVVSIVSFIYLEKFANTSMHAVFRHNILCGKHSIYVFMNLPTSAVNNMAARSRILPLCIHVTYGPLSIARFIYLDKIVRFIYLDKFVNTSMHAVFRHNIFCGKHSAYIVQLLSSKIVHFDDKSMKLCQITTIPKAILVPRGRAPFGQHQESRPLAKSNTGSPRFTDFPSLCACSESSLTNLIGSGLNLLCLQSHSKTECRWRRPEVAILGADQKERGLWGRECPKANIF